MFATILRAWPGVSPPGLNLGLALVFVLLGAALAVLVQRSLRRGGADAVARSDADAVGRGAERVLAFGSNPACRYRSDTTLTWVNRACAELVGRTPEELVGSRWVELVDPAAADAVRPRIDAITARRPTGREEGWLNGPDGRAYVRWDQHALLDEDGEVREIFALGTDLTQLRAVLDEIEQGEERLALALDAGNFGTWDYDVVSGRVERNARWHATLGRAPGEVPANLDGWKEIVHPDDLASALAATEANFDACTTNWSVEYRLRHGDGHWVWVEDRGRVVKRDGDGRPLRAVGVVQDVSERHAAVLELRASRTEARRESEAKGRFLANMSHEIRTPLTAVLGYAELAREELAEVGPPSDTASVGALDTAPICSHLDAVLRNGRHLSQLIDEILDLSKIEADEVTVQCVPTDPRAIVREVCDMLDVRAGERDIALDLDVSGPLPAQVRTDALRVRQILVNIVGNAVKFSPEGGRVDVAARLVHGGARVLDADAPAEWHVEVRDRASGMDAATLERVFEPFVQGEGPNAERTGGTGLGLAISRRLAALLGGDVVATSEVGVGSRFRLCLPLGPDELANVVHEVDRVRGALPTPAPRQKGRGRVLLAEDGADNRRLIRLVLTRAGFETVAVDDGERAVHAAEDAVANDRPFDLILMDVQMPVLDGYAATRRLRAAGIDTPIVALTANAFSDERANSTEAGCTAHTTKPIARETFVADVVRWIDAGRRSEHSSAS